MKSPTPKTKNALPTCRLFASHTTMVSLDTLLPLTLLAKYRELREEIIKEVFRELTGKWDRNFVIYPISSYEDIQLMM